MAIRTPTPPASYEEGTAVSPEEYERIALADPDRKWELRRGRLREKPAMSIPHNRATMRLGKQLLAQLDEADYEVRIDMSRVRRGGETFYIPDLFVVPTSTVDALLAASEARETFTGPLPLVVEVWSPSTGAYDVGEKLREYQRRGDLEIWRLHPHERTLTAWRRRPDGGDDEPTFTGGTVQPVALPNVSVEVDALFDA